MKKLLTLVVLSFYLISSTELRELTKLPVLFQHFYEHKALNHEITFTDFIADHYNAVPHTDNDEERDMQLPFKSLDFNMLFIPAIPPPCRVCVQKPLKTLIVNRRHFYMEEFVPSADGSKIWQPPKFDRSFII